MLVTLHLDNSTVFRERERERERREKVAKKRKKFLNKPLTTSIGFALDMNLIGSLYTFVDLVEDLYLDTVEVDSGGNTDVEYEDCWYPFEGEYLEGDENSEVTK